MKKILLLILLFYILALLQTSFFAHFRIFNYFNFILILVILINLWEREESSFGLWSAGIAGFFLDIFSTGFNFMGINFFGFYILILLGISLFIKFVFKKYVQPWRNILEIKK